MRKSKSKAGKIAIFIIILIIAAVVAFFSLVFWNSSYTVPKYKFSQQLLDKIIESQVSGSTIKLDSEELNEVLSPLFASGKTSGNFTVKGVNAEIDENTLKFYVPLSYRQFNFLMTTGGKVYIEDGNIAYSPDYFKLGKINIPKSYVFDKISSKLGDSAKVQDNAIVFISNKLPVSIESITVQNGSLFIKSTQSKLDLRQKLNLFRQMMNSPALMDKMKQHMNQSGSMMGGSGVSNSGSSQNEQAVISEIVSAINSRDKSALVSAEADYNKLSSESQNRVKSKIESSLDKSTLEKIQQYIN